MKGIIFDLDGVIVHTDHYHYLAWKKMCDLYGFVFDEEINQHLRGISRMDSLEIILSYNNVEYSLKEKLKMTELKNENSKKLVKRGKIPLFSKNLNIININFAYL